MLDQLRLAGSYSLAQLIVHEAGRRLHSQIATLNRKRDSLTSEMRNKIGHSHFK